MIKRTLVSVLKNYASKFSAISITGPRHSGKTTLACATFPLHHYVSLEAPFIRQSALDDPRKFLRDMRNEHGVILGELQNGPLLLSYLQTIIDEEQKTGYFIITGSQNLLLNQAISQSLAGRVAILTLLPLSIPELKQAVVLTSSIEELVWRGGYPRTFAKAILSGKWYSSYIKHILNAMYAN